MGKTIVEKIMAKAAGKPEVSPGDYLKFGIKDTYIQVGSDIGALNSREYERLGWDKFFDLKEKGLQASHKKREITLPKQMFDEGNENQQNSTQKKQKEKPQST